MNVRNIQQIVACLLLGMIGNGLALSVHAQNIVDIEAGIVFTGYNNVAIPGNSGSRFSLSDDLDAEQAAAIRVRLSRTDSDKHWFGLLLAPLSVRSHGTLKKNVVFNGVNFTQGSDVDATFRFDSYRFIYRYLFQQKNAYQFSIGGALKIRDAAITLQTNGLKSVKDNTGLVPLASFNFTWTPYNKLSLLIDGEALIAPQGRAEDMLFAAQYEMNESLSVKTGYRLLEGGADNDEVYTFSLFHYFIIGALWTF